MMFARYVVPLALILTIPIMQRSPARVRADSQVVGTPTATAPVASPTATSPTLPASKPSATTILRRSGRAMADIHQVHSEGVMADGRKALAQGIYLTADCDGVAGKFRVRLETASDRSKFLEFVIFKHRDWFRSWDHPAWELDTQADVDVLIPVLAPACPVTATGASSVPANGPLPPHVRIGAPHSDVVDGVPVWHVRVTVHSKKNKARVDLYADQVTYREVRLIVQQTSPGYYADMHYSRFNEPIEIPRPIAGTTP